MSFVSKGSFDSSPPVCLEVEDKIAAEVKSQDNKRARKSENMDEHITGEIVFQRNVKIIKNK